MTSDQKTPRGGTESHLPHLPAASGLAALLTRRAELQRNDDLRHAELKTTERPRSSAAPVVLGMSAVLVGLVLGAALMAPIVTPGTSADSMRVRTALALP